MKVYDHWKTESFHNSDLVHHFSFNLNTLRSLSWECIQRMTDRLSRLKILSHFPFEYCLLEVEHRSVWSIWYS